MNEYFAQPRKNQHHPQHPPTVLIEWVKLAIRYQYAGLGNDISKQTELALADVLTFMSQPAEAYCALHYQPCKYDETSAGLPLPAAPEEQP